MDTIKEQTIERNKKINEIIDWGKLEIQQTIIKIDGTKNRLHEILSHVHGLITSIKILIVVLIIWINLIGLGMLIKWIF